jgi:lysyl-tRNA synthetase class 2
VNYRLPGLEGSLVLHRTVEKEAFLTYQRVSSSCIAEVGYDRFDRTLAVRFHKGSEYWYAGVPPEIHHAFLTAASKGRYFNAEVRDFYRHQRAR